MQRDEKQRSIQPSMQKQDKRKSGSFQGLIRELDKFGRKTENSESVEFQTPYSCWNLRKIWLLGFVLYDHGFV
ncbi:hypothetical protein K1719_021047 [Acacia pycnantha]|nr:hypothetical protein K1719_021047 [Acacia pycnantha]